MSNPGAEGIGDKYVLGGRRDHDRLHVISEIHDGRTRALLTQAGFARGTRFVEFGCGMGYVTRWAASEGAGRAIGIDVNPEQVAASAALAHEEGLSNVEFRTGSVYEPGFAPGSIDISYSRWLMIHLTRPVDAMRAIYEALTPGGVMVCEEADISCVYAEPPSAAYAEMVECALQAGPPRGVDYSGGRRVHTWALDAGFELEHADAYHPHYLSGPYKSFWNWTLRNAAQGLVLEGLLEQAKLDQLVAGMSEADASPTTVVAHCRMHQLIARKPR